MLNYIILILLLLFNNSCTHFQPTGDQGEHQINSTISLNDTVKDNQESTEQRGIIPTDIKSEKNNAYSYVKNTVNYQENSKSVDDIYATITKVCGEKFTPCSIGYQAYNMFSSSSPCQSCSCDVKTCYISRNCCPDIGILDHQDTDDMNKGEDFVNRKTDKTPMKTTASLVNNDDNDVDRENKATSSVKNEDNGVNQVTSSITNDHTDLTPVNKATSPVNNDVIDLAPANKTTDVAFLDKATTSVNNNDIDLAGLNKVSSPVNNDDQRANIDETEGNKEQPFTQDDLTEILSCVEVDNFLLSALRPLDLNIMPESSESVDSSSSKHEQDQKQTPEHETDQGSSGILDLYLLQSAQPTDNIESDVTGQNSDYDNRKKGILTSKQMVENIKNDSHTTELVNKWIDIENKHTNKSVDRYIPSKPVNNSLTNEEPFESSSKQLSSNQTQSNSAFQFKQPKFYHLVYQKCPKDFNDSETRKRCEYNNSTYLLDYIPTSDWISQKIYKNKWCALCHGSIHHQDWQLITDCLNLYTTYYLPYSISQLREITQNCSLKLVPPLGVQSESQICNTVPEQFSNAVTKCNTTGSWRNTNKNIKALCEMNNYMATYTDARAQQPVAYKNVFCYVCNTNEDLETIKLTTKDIDNKEADFPNGRLYMGVFVQNPDTTPMNQLHSGDTTHSLMCDEGTIIDLYSESCIKFQCPLYQIAMGSICLDHNRDVTGLVISGIIRLQPQNEPQNGTFSTAVDYGVISTFGNHILDVLDQKLRVSATGCEIRYAKMLANITSNSDTQFKDILIDYKLANTNLCSIKDIVNIFSKLSSGQENLNVTLNTETKISKGISKKIENDDISSQTSSPKSVSYKLSMVFTQLFQQTIETVLIHKIHKFEISLPYKFDCARVMINIKKYMKLVHDGFLAKTDVEGIISAEVSTSGLVPVCFNDYVNHWANEQSGQTSQAQIISLSVTMSTVSTIVSMISTVIVLFTYFLFSELRFIPGKLFMILCFNLLIAQGLYTFGIDQVADNLLCSIIGMAVHFFWVATIFSMSSCLWLLLKNFKKPLEGASMAIIQSRSNTEVFKNILYCYTMAALCVLTNIIISRSLFRDNHYGYGGEICYINTREMRLFTFVLPISVVLLLNFIMFLRILSKISQTTYKKNCSILRYQILIILRLSTITGCYWCFGFIYELTQFKVFEYLFIVLNAGQGFFLMWSFLFNTRVLGLYIKLYKKSCCFKEEMLVSDSTC